MRENRQARKKLAIIIEEFFRDAAFGTEEEIKSVYNRQNNKWHRLVKAHNADNKNKVFLNCDAFEIEVKDKGYIKIITKPIPKDEKIELLRILKIVENKNRLLYWLREQFYKMLFVKILTKERFKTMIQ